jgi:transmembrane sensor
LLKGEAHFEVAKNPQRPFMVYAGEGMVWAVGTAFNVRYVGNQKQADNYIDVTVTEGTVKVFAQVNQEQFKEKQQPVETDKKAIEPAQSASAQSLNPENNAPPLKEQIVHAGKSVHYTSVIETIQLTSAEAVEQKLAWQQGAIIFSGETLEQAIQEIARYTERQLTIVDPAIKNIRVGGHYKTNDINGLLASLSQGFNIQVSYVNSQQIELSSKQLKKHQPIAPAEPHPVIPAEPHHPVIPSERSDEGSHQPKPKPKPKPKKNNKSPKPLRVNYATPVSNTCNTK